LEIALLMPSFASPNYQGWERTCERVAAEHQTRIRTLHYVHWDDPVIANALRSFAGVLLVPSSEKVTPFAHKLLVKAKKLVVLDGDFSSLGLVSLKLNPPAFINRMGDHLYRLGHRRIDCLNTQPDAGAPFVPIQQWKLWCSMHGVTGRVIDDQVKPYGDPMAHAHHVMCRLLDAGQFTATALLCMTQPAATGAIRALTERGLAVARDVSVCAIDGTDEVRYLTPSRTALLSPPPDPYLRAFLAWMSKPERRWEGPLLVEADNVELFEGESTGPCCALRPRDPAARRTSAREAHPKRKAATPRHVTKGETT
jgi:DNA-binding LacI/PurR family transcriptional regulator